MSISTWQNSPRVEISEGIGWQHMAYACDVDVSGKQGVSSGFE